MAAKRILTVEMLVRGLAMKYEGKTYDEIAKALGCSRATVARWLPQMEKTLKDHYPQIKVEQGEVRVESTDEKISRVLEKLEKVESELEEIKKITLKLLQRIS